MEQESRNVVAAETLAYNRDNGRVGVYSFHAPLRNGLTGTAITVAAVRIGDHAHVHVESGNAILDPSRDEGTYARATRGFAGKLILRWHEWLLFRDTLSLSDRIHVVEVENPTPGMAGLYAKARPDAA